MVILIGGASHTGKTCLAQRLLEKYQYPYLSIDHLKMALIRSGATDLSPISGATDLTAMSDTDMLTDYLWPIVREYAKTAIENNQNLIIEGCYIPFDWQKDFDREYLVHTRYVCLILSENYIRKHFEDIMAFANVIERRLDDSDFTIEEALKDNALALRMCREYDLNYLLIEDKYSFDVEILN